MKINHITFQVPSHAEVMDLSTRLKDDDVREVWALSGLSPHDAMERMMSGPALMTGAYVDGRLEMVFGVNDNGYQKGLAAVWMVSSNVVYQYGKSLLKLGRKWLDMQQKRHGILFNFVDARATRTLKWLERMGFKFQAVHSHGVHGLPFVLVTRGDDNVL